MVRHSYSEAIAKQSFLKRQKNWKLAQQYEQAGIINKEENKNNQLINYSIEKLEEKYVIGKHLGDGAFGAVSECWLKGTNSGEVFALKKMAKKGYLSTNEG